MIPSTDFIWIAYFQEKFNAPAHPQSASLSPDVLCIFREIAAVKTDSLPHNNTLFLARVIPV